MKNHLHCPSTDEKNSPRAWVNNKLTNNFEKKIYFRLPPRNFGLPPLGWPIRSCVSYHKTSASAEPSFVSISFCFRSLNKGLGDESLERWELHNPAPSLQTDNAQIGPACSFIGASLILQPQFCNCAHFGNILKCFSSNSCAFNSKGRHKKLFFYFWSKNWDPPRPLPLLWPPQFFLIRIFLTRPRPPPF